MKYYTSTTEFNCGIDLHARQMYVCVMDRQGKKQGHCNVQDNDWQSRLCLPTASFVRNRERTRAGPEPPGQPTSPRNDEILEHPPQAQVRKKLEPGKPGSSHLSVRV